MDKYWTKVLEFVVKLQDIIFEPNEYMRFLDNGLNSIWSEGKLKYLIMLIDHFYLKLNLTLFKF